MKEKITAKKILTNLDAIITGVTLSLCTILVNVNVFMRYLLKKPLTWTEEAVTALFVWTVFIGAAYAYRKHAHLGIDMLVNMFPVKARKVIKLVMALIELFIIVLITIISSQYAYHLLFNRQGVLDPIRTELMRVPKFYAGVAVPIGFILTTCYSIYFLLTDHFGLVKSNKEGI